MLRVIGWLFAIAGLAALAYDIYRGPYAGGQLELSRIAEIWFDIHRASLIGLNSFTEKSLSPGIWDKYILPVLEFRAALAFVIAALVCFLGSIRTGRKNGGKRDRMMFPR